MEPKWKAAAIADLRELPARHAPRVWHSLPILQRWAITMAAGYGSHADGLRRADQALMGLPATHDAMLVARVLTRIVAVDTVPSVLDAFGHVALASRVREMASLPDEAGALSVRAILYHCAETCRRSKQPMLLHSLLECAAQVATWSELDRVGHEAARAQVLACSLLVTGRVDQWDYLDHYVACVRVCLAS